MNEKKDGNDVLQYISIPVKLRLILRGPHVEENDQLPNGKTCALSLLTVSEEEHLKID